MSKGPLESIVEAYLVKRVAELGGVAEKTTALGSRGYFDRTVVLPGGRVIFCELKKPKGGRLSPQQIRRHTLYRTIPWIRPNATLAGYYFYFLKGSTNGASATAEKRQ
jgi:hypothetical protein